MIVVTDFESLSDKSDPAVLYRELRGYRNQMMVNNHYAEQYEKALIEICTLLGWKPHTGSCFGPPPPDINETALELVRSKLL